MRLAQISVQRRMFAVLRANCVRSGALEQQASSHAQAHSETTVQVPACVPYFPSLFAFALQTSGSFVESYAVCVCVTALSVCSAVYSACGCGVISALCHYDSNLPLLHRSMLSASR